MKIKIKKKTLKKIMYVVLLIAILAVLIFFGIGTNKEKGSADVENVVETEGSSLDTEVEEMNYPVVVLETSMGNIEIELYEDKAPISVKNFLDYVNSGFYDGLIFHRVIDDFMIQGGGFDKEMSQKPTKAPIKNEADNGLKNEKYTVAMARTQVVDSATAQFFINVVANTVLDHRDKSLQGYGYAVFGKVIDGIDVVIKIKAVETTTKNGHQNVPVEPVIIEKAYVKK